MILRRLTEDGLSQMRSFLDSLATSNPEDDDREILTDSATSAPLPVAITIDEAQSFPRRYEAGKYLFEQLAPLRSARYQCLERDSGVWAWLALLWFDQLCPADRHGRRKPGEHARFIPEMVGFRYYRHLLLGPYVIYAAHRDAPERALCVLTQKLHSPGDLVGQIASRQMLVTSRAVVELATSLFCDKDGRQRSGVQDSRRETPGTPRRLADVLMQFDLTYDLHSISSNQLSSLLPAEFGRWRHHA